MKVNDKKLKSDSSGESVMRPFVLIFALIVIFALTVAGIGRMAYSAELQDREMSYIGEEFPLDLWNYSLIEPDVGIDIDPERVINQICHPTENDPYIFIDNTTDDKKYIHIIRNNSDYEAGSSEIWKMYKDFIAIRRETDKWVVGPKWNDGIVPYTTIANNYDNVTNVSMVDFRLSGRSDTLFINTTNTSDEGFLIGLWGNNYTLYYGWNNWRLDDINFWDAISLVMFDSLPGVHPIVDFLIKALIYGTIVFVIFTMVTRTIPFIGGA